MRIFAALLLSAALALPLAADANPIKRTMKVCEDVIEVDQTDGVNEVYDFGKFWGPVDETILVPDFSIAQGYEFTNAYGEKEVAIVTLPMFVIHIVDSRWVEDPKKYARVGERVYNKLVRKYGEPEETNVAFVWTTEYGQVVLGSARYIGKEGIAIGLVCRSQ